MKTATKKARTIRTHTPWFKSHRGSYIPVHWKGWVTYIPYLAYLYLSYALLVPNRPPFETIVFLVPYWVAGVIVMHWIAKIKS